MSAIFVNDALAHYEVLGRGKPIIFLHSWIGSWRYWVPVMQTISSYYRTFALDLWGFGDSGKYEGRYTLKDQRNLLADFIQHMGLQDVTLVGHGLGAVVVSFFAADYPEIVQRSVLISFPLENGLNYLRLSKLSLEDAIAWLFERHTDHENIRHESLKTDQKAVKFSIQQVFAVNRRQLALRIPVSTLWIFNRNDPLCRPPGSAVLSSLSESSGYVIFPESGHFPMLSEANRFDRLLLEFMETQPGKKPVNLRLKQEWKRRLR